MSVPSTAHEHALVGELYVSTGLSTWKTHESDRIARNCTVNTTAYRRLDPEYYAWLRSRMNLAQLAAKAGRLDEAEFEELRGRFNTIHAWATARFGELPLLNAMRSLGARNYSPPAAEPYGAAQRGTAAHRAEHAASPEAVALVDAIREKAIALGWRPERLGVTGRRGIGSDYGLVGCLRPGDRIGEVTRQSIEIIGAPPAEVRRRFYNPDVEQPWVKRAALPCA